MQSFSLYTSEIDDLDTALSALKAQYDEKLVSICGLKKHSAAIVLCDPDTDMQPLLLGIKERIFNIPTIACTSIAMFDKRHGFLDTGISILVLTADDVEFSVTVTDEVLSGNLEEKIKEAYLRGCMGMKTSPSAILAFGTDMTTADANEIGVSYTGDEVLNAIDKASGGVPLFGGQGSDDFVFTKIRVAAEGNVRKNAVALLLFGAADITKIIAKYEFSIIDPDVFDGVITKAHGNTIEEVDGENILDVLDRLRITEGLNGLSHMQFVPFPFMITTTDKNGGHIDKLRLVARINRDNKSISFIGSVTEGAKIRLMQTSHETLKDSVANVLDSIIDQMGKDSRKKYSTILSTSCLARYLNLGALRDEESNAFKGRLPEGLEVLGMYSTGEFYPYKNAESDSIHNVFFNSTITMVAF